MDYDGQVTHTVKQTPRPADGGAVVRVHHANDHQAYVDKLNAALEGSDRADAAIDELLNDLEGLPVRKE